MKCRRCQYENPSPARFCMACGAGLGVRTKRRKAEAVPRGRRKPPKSEAPQVEDLEKRLAESLEREKAKDRALTEALDQQTATSEILRVISQAPGDLQPVLTAVAQNAARLCDARDVGIVRLDGGSLRMVAGTGVFSEMLAPDYNAQDIPATRASVTGRAITDRMTIHVHDLAEESEAEYPHGRALQKRYGHRTMLATPLLREGLAIGAISICRFEVRPFSESQIALLKTFADQAVIAIENVRLFTELQTSNRELTTALGTQTATADILRVISRAQTNVQPVFDTILASAVRLLGAYAGLLTRLAGEQIEIVALTSTDDAGDAALRAAFPHSRHTEGGHAQVIRDRVPLNVADAWIDPRVPAAVRAAARARGNQSLVVVPLLRRDEAVGAIGVTRRDPGGFTDDEIALLETFADQAVIAIENVRLFNETKEALERQTATAEILRIIATSPTDLQRALDATADSAARVCNAYDASIFRLDGDVLRLVAHHGPIANPNGLTIPVTRRSVTGRTVLDPQTIHVVDVQAETEQFPEGSALARELGYRTILTVPLVREGAAVGVIGIRRTEVKPFTEQQIALLKTFADQAVIAIENVRLFTELQEKNRAITTAHAQVTESLEQQTATSDILRVISSSPTDVQPVFETIARSATTLCEADLCHLYRYDGDLIHFAAEHGGTPAETTAAQRAFPQAPSRLSVTARAILKAAIVQVADVSEEPEVADSLRMFRTVLSVPMRRDRRPLGAITVARRVVRPFTDKQIELLQTFADQAVIAIENVRLFNETKEALERQTATSEILRVISSSPTDVQPVYDAIVRSAVTLCGATLATVYRRENDLVHLVGIQHEHPHAAAVAAAYPAPLTSSLMSCRAILENAVIHLPDVEADGALPSEGLRLARLSGFRSVVSVPLRRDGISIGAILVGGRRSACSRTNRSHSFRPLLTRPSSPSRTCASSMSCRRRIERLLPHMDRSVRPCKSRRRQRTSSA
jgi:GAF domain-containing protein